MEREQIISEIRRVAKELGTNSLGRTKFEGITGISQGIWHGKYWSRWSEAVAEAGLVPGTLQTAHDRGEVLESVYDLTRSLDRFPTMGEMKLQRRKDNSFPSHGAIERLGNRATLIGMVRDFAMTKGDDHIRALLTSVSSNEESTEQASPGSDGHVYMMRLGRHYKIGKTFSVPRRHREIALELPEKPDVVHAIRTDDPDGIEAYWHRRFAERRTNGEWFALSPEEVKAFKRRKFM